MYTLRARVSGGRIHLDEPTDLPDGTELDVLIDADDDLDADERAARSAAIERSWESAQAGRTRPVETILARLHAKG
jgi:hypothetical protein